MTSSLDWFVPISLFSAGWGVLIGVCWLVVGWRAMRAHEQLAEAVERLSMRLPPVEPR